MEILALAYFLVILTGQPLWVNHLLVFREARAEKAAWDRVFRMVELPERGLAARAELPAYQAPGVGLCRREGLSAVGISSVLWGFSARWVFLPFLKSPEPQVQEAIREPAGLRAPVELPDHPALR